MSHKRGRIDELTPHYQPSFTPQTVTKTINEKDGEDERKTLVKKQLLFDKSLTVWVEPEPGS